jgi:uncharacterized membrane protein
MARVKALIAAHRKAIVALVVGVGGGLYATRVGHPLTDAQMAVIVEVLTALGVYATPNTPA